MNFLQGAFIALWHINLVLATGIINQNLVNELTKDYDTRTIPEPSPGNDTVVVNISMALRMVVELNAKQQVLTTSMWITQRWYDNRLRWNITDYHNLEKVIIPKDEIWKPDLILYDNTDFDYSGSIQNVFATAWSNGTVLLVYPALYKSACLINIYYFPFDEQTCKIRFSSWTYDSSILKFDLYPSPHGDPDGTDTSYYKFNSEWLLTKFTASTNPGYQHDCCVDPMHDVTYQLTLRRRSIMLFYYLYFPNILINIIATFQFLLPCDSTEKVTLGITILLAMIVYLLLMEEMLPQTEDVPIIVHYMSVTLGLVTGSLLITILVLEVHHNGKHDNHSQLPHWARRYLLHGLARILRMDKYITDDSVRDHLLNPETSQEDLIHGDILDMHSHYGYDNSKHEHEHHEHGHHEDESHEHEHPGDHDAHEQSATNQDGAPPHDQECTDDDHEPECHSVELPPLPTAQANHHSPPATPDSYSEPVKNLSAQRRSSQEDYSSPMTRLMENQNVSNANPASQHLASNLRARNRNASNAGHLNPHSARSLNSYTGRSQTQFQPDCRVCTNNMARRNSHMNCNACNALGWRGSNRRNTGSALSNASSMYGSQGGPPHSPSGNAHSTQDSSHKHSLVLKRSELTSSRDLLLLKILHYCEDFAERATIEDREQELSCEWQQLAMLLDRLVFYIYILITIIVWIIILGSKPRYSDEGIR